MNRTDRGGASAAFVATDVRDHPSPLGSADDRDDRPEPGRREHGPRRPAVRDRARGVVAQRAVQDGILAAVLTGASLVGAFADLHLDLPDGGADTGLRELDIEGTGLLMLQTVPLAWRRVAPVAVLALTGAAVFVFAQLGYGPSLAAFGFLIALYTVAAYRPRRTSIAAGAASYAGLLLILLLGREGLEPDAVFAEFLFVGAAWWLGDGLRIRRGQLVELEDRATALEREREERAERAVAEERRVIARELHDVVAHNVSIMVAQAGAAQRIFDEAPGEARTVLATIERVGREALVEMRRLMGLLRTQDDDHRNGSPQPSLRNLDVLIEQVRAAGLPVAVAVEGAPRPLPAGLDMSAFRIIQEALTNVLKHAGPANVDIVIRYGRRALELTVSDDGRGDAPGPASGAGYGQLGMRERVALFNGTLRVRTRPGGGYRVHAWLPLDGAPA